MRRIIYILLHLLGIVLNLIGLAGIPDDVENWGKALKMLHGYVNDPLIYLAFIAAGLLLTTYTAAFWVSDYRLRRLGGESGREFPAKLIPWDGVQNFTVWQISWLWNNLEPVKGGTEGTSAYPTFRRLKEQLSQGIIKDAKQVNSSWLWTTLTRQQIIDYAYEVDQFPEFIFKEERLPYIFKTVRKWMRNEISYRDAKKYNSLWDLMSDIYQHYFEIGAGINTREDIWPVVKHWVESGQYKAIGRRKRDGLLFHFEEIPPWMWEHMQYRDFTELKWAGYVFCDIRVKQIVERVE